MINRSQVGEDLDNKHSKKNQLPESEPCNEIARLVENDQAN